MAEKKKNKSKNNNGVLKLIKNGCTNALNFVHTFLSNMMIRTKKQRKKAPVAPWKSMAHLFLFGFVFLYFELLLRLFTGTGFFSHLIYPVLFSIAAGCLLNVFTTLLNKKINWLITMVILSFSSIYFIAECLIKRSFHTYMTIGHMLANAGDVMGHYANNMITTIVGGAFVILLYLLPVVLYGLFGKKLIPAQQYKWPVALVNLVNSGIVLVITIAVAWIGGLNGLYTTSFEFNRATETFGLVTGTRLAMTRDGTGSLVPVNTTEGVEEDFSQYKKNVLDIDFDKLIKEDEKKYKEIDQYVNSLPGTSMNKYTGLFKGKNLILICAEAWSDADVIEELTPTLYRMVHNGFYFSDFYQPYWGGSTTTGEFSFLLGMVPTGGPNSMRDTIGHNNYFTMQNQLQRIGYYTAGYHNGDYTYYDRDQTHPNMGMNKWIAKDGGLEDIAGKGYPRDWKLIPGATQDNLQHQPFCEYIMTLDGHFPYTVPEWQGDETWDFVESVVGDSYTDEAMSYFCYQYQLEKAMKLLIELLEEEGIAQDTVVCMTADHYPYGMSDLEDLYHHKIEDLPDQDHNAWVLWSECLEEGGDLASYRCDIDVPTYSLDIIPTLSNLFGLEYDSRMLVGRDVFSDAMPLVLWPNYSWKSTKGYYSAKNDSFTIYEDDVDVSDEYIDTISQLVKSKHDFSKMVVDTDYFAHLFGKDEIKDSTELWKQMYGTKKEE